MITFIPTPESLLDEYRGKRDSQTVVLTRRRPAETELENLPPEDAKEYLKLRKVFDKDYEADVSLERLAAS
jgi:hypothetical protein